MEVGQLAEDNPEDISELWQFVEDNLDNITLVEDFFNLPDFKFNDFDNDLNMNEEKIYRNMNIFKKYSQILLNMYHSQKEYQDCEILEYQFLGSMEPDGPFFNIDYKNSNKQCLIKVICNFIKYNRIIQSIEMEKEYELYNFMGGFCLYCDSVLDENNFCSCCSANNDDFRTYIQLHKNTLKRKKNDDKKIEIRISEEVKERIDSWEIQNGARIRSTMNSKRKSMNRKTNELDKISKDGDVDEENEMQWICETCGLINIEDFCLACLSSKPVTASKQNRLRISVEKSSTVCSNFSDLNSKNDRNFLLNTEENISTVQSDPSWQCILPNCLHKNSEKDQYCEKCGLHKLREEAKLLYQNITVWTCTSCYTVFKIQSGLCRKHCKINHYGGADDCEVCKTRFKGVCRACSQSRKSLFYTSEGFMTSL